MLNKKSFFKLSALILFSITLFVSCYTPSYKTEIAGLDNLHATLIKSKDLLNKVDTNKINQRFKTFLLNSNKVKALTIKLSDNDKTLVEDYAIFGNSFFREYMIQYKKLKKETTFSINQLDSLKADLLNGRLPKSAFESYFRTEKNAAENLNSSVSMFTGTIGNYEKKFDDMNSKIVELIGKK